MTVYVEAYALINIAMDLLLLSLCALLSGKRLKAAGTALSCLLGGAYSVAAYALSPGLLLNVIAKISCTLAMVFLAFGRTPFRELIKLFIAFFAASFAAGGTGFGVIFLLGAGGFGYGAILLTAIATTALVYFILGSKKARRMSSWRVQVIIEGEAGSMAIDAFIDSGNSLTEPITALPVAVCFLPEIRGLLPKSELKAAYTSVGGTGELALYVPKAVYRVDHGKRKRLADLYIAFSGAEKSGEFDLLLPPSVFI